MRACDHYLKAEQSVELIVEAARNGEVTDDEVANTLAAAQVHATLAVAGAHALNAYSRGDEPELDEWAAAAGGVDPDEIQLSAGLRDSLVALGWTPPAGQEQER